MSQYGVCIVCCAEREPWMSEKCVLMSCGKTELERTWKTKTQMVNNTVFSVKALNMCFAFAWLRVGPLNTVMSLRVPYGAGNFLTI